MADDNKEKEAEGEVSVGNLREEDDDDDVEQAKQWKDMKASRGMLASMYMSAWVVDMERQKEGYTAGRGETYCAMVTASLTLIGMTVFYIMAFCRIDIGNETIGFGADVFSTLVATGAENRDVQGNEISTGFLVAGATLFCVFFIYLFDVFFWRENGKIMGFMANIIILAGFAGMFVTAVLLTNEFPAAPFLAFIIFTICVLFALKMALFNAVQKLFFLRSLMVTSLLCGLGVLIIYCYSVFVDGNYYSDEVLVLYQSELDCPEDPNFPYDELLQNVTFIEEFFADGGSLPECDEAFLVWAAPAIFFCIAFVFSFVLLFLFRAEKKRIASRRPVGLEPMAQIFIAVMTLSLLGLWVAASIASATAALGDAILSLSFVSLILLLGVAVAIFGTKYLDSQLRKTPIGKKAYDFFGSNWGKALLVVVGTPLLLMFLAVDFIKQLIRRKTPLGKHLDEQERRLKFTKPVSDALVSASKWEFGSVITKALVLGMAFFILSVGVSRITVVFLSYLRETLLAYTLIQTTLILVVVGLIMFLLPPVPGVPVYITAGVILPSLAEKEDWSFAGGIIYAIGVSLAMKLMALVMQQKLIGEMCGANSVSVRYAVGVNSVELRAMKRILKKPGFSLGKIAILCGGPDWPTSVLTGIMRLSVIEMLLGTLPVVFLIAPCVISGAMIVKSGEEPDETTFASMNTIAVFLTVIVQSAAMLGAVQVLASAAVKYEDELKAEEPDQEVLALEEKNRAKQENYAVVTAWVNLPSFWRALHLINLTFMIIACYAFQLFGSSIFITFDVTGDIGTDLGGNALHIVTEVGWIFVSLYLIAMIYYFVFKQAHQGKIPTAQQVKEEQQEEEEAIADKEKGAGLSI